MKTNTFNFTDAFFYSKFISAASSMYVQAIVTYDSRSSTEYRLSLSWNAGILMDKTIIQVYKRVNYGGVTYKQWFSLKKADGPITDLLMKKRIKIRGDIDGCDTRY